MLYDNFYLKYLGARIVLFVRFYAFFRNSLLFLFCMLGTPSCQRRQYALTLRRKKNEWHQLFPLWQLHVSVEFGERIFTVYALFIRKWSTVLQHRTMVSTCKHIGWFGGTDSYWTCVYFCSENYASHAKTWPSFHQSVSPLTMLTYLHAASSGHVVDSNCRILFQYPMILRRLILRSRKF